MGLPVVGHVRGKTTKSIADLDAEAIDNGKDSDIVRVGNFVINIEMVSKLELINMRKYLPPEEYRLLKNRKSARLCRRKRKEERGDMKKQLEMYQRENWRLQD